MRSEDAGVEPSRHGRPVDPDFGLDPGYRRRLTGLGRAQYDAAKDGNRRRVNQLRSRLTEESPLGAGVGRVVYPLPERAYRGGQYDGYVLKLPVPDRHDRYGFDRDGRSQNRMEASLWERFHSAWFVPVSAADQRGQWLVMPRGQPIERDPEWLDAWRSGFVDAHDLPSTQGQDLLAENLVLLEEQPRLCDYGVLSS
jgi:hypothetical protein